jgi:UDP-glucose 4-epimerase
MKPRNICLIGGNGFLGSNFRDAFHNDFDKILVLGRNMNIGPLRKNEIYHSIATLSIARVAEVIRNENIDTVIDLSYNTVPKSSFDNPISDFSENLYTVIHHLEIIRCLPGVKYVYVSSGGTVYGNAENTKPITEEHPNIPLSPYGITKLTSERYALMYKAIYDLDVIILRPSNVYGPGQKPFKGQGFIATAIAKGLQGNPVQIFGDGTHVRDYVYISDFCSALKEIIEKGKNGSIYNIGFGKGYTINEVTEKIRDIGGVQNLKVESLPARPFDVHYNVLDYKRIKALTDWEPKVQLEEGLSLSAQWIKGYLKN